MAGENNCPSHYQSGCLGTNNDGKLGDRAQVRISICRRRGTRAHDRQAGARLYNISKGEAAHSDVRRIAGLVARSGIIRHPRKGHQLSSSRTVAVAGWNKLHPVVTVVGGLRCDVHRVRRRSDPRVTAQLREVPRRSRTPRKDHCELFGRSAHGLVNSGLYSGIAWAFDCSKPYGI